MANEEAGTWDFRSKVQVLQKPLNEVLDPEAIHEVLFHISEVLTDFNRLQHEMLTIVGRSDEQSEPTDSLVAKIIGWFETLRSGWAPHWQDHASEALALLQPDEEEHGGN